MAWMLLTGVGVGATAQAEEPADVVPMEQAPVEDARAGEEAGEGSGEARESTATTTRQPRQRRREAATKRRTEASTKQR